MMTEITHIKTGISPAALFSGLISTCGYGIWTYFINQESSNVAYSVSWQMLLNFMGSFLTASATEILFRKTQHPVYRFIFSAYVPAGVCILVFCIVHFFIGTPNIIETVAPNTAIAIVYFTLYTLRMENQRNASEN